MLVDRPRGWLPGREAGSIAYEETEIEPLVDGITVAYVGRFTAVKRLPLLIEAFAAANERTSTPAGLVLIGGHPGEWEGEHPAETIARIEANGVFLAGWHDHSRLPDLLCAADVVALTSSREQFGLVLVEGMACERPAVATRSPGPVSIISDGTTGWLTADDSADALTRALTEAIDDHAERARRGRAARRVVCDHYTWDAIAERLAAVLNGVVMAVTSQSGRLLD
jgi:glycosyltransferase involved in cell wall biosynthesis